MTRSLCWFSAGAASAVATKIVLQAIPPERVVIAYTDTGAEHPDNRRFIEDCEKWFDHEVITLRSERYSSTWQVWEQRRFLNSPQGALCTAELKKKVRFKFEQPDDVQVFGYTADSSDVARAVRFRDQNPGVTLATPLIDRGLTKTDCLALIDRAGIEVPAMYQLGYLNNNCVGCVKGGMGYWNKIRVDFPDTFTRMALLERDIGASCIRKDGEHVWLDELDPERGDYPSELSMDCSLTCAVTEGELT